MWFTPQGIQNWPKFLNRGKPNHSKLTRKCFNFGTSLFSTTADSYRNIVWVSTISDKKVGSKWWVMDRQKDIYMGLTGLVLGSARLSNLSQLYLGLIASISTFVPISIVSIKPTHIPHITLCQLKCTWSQSKPLEYKSIRPIAWAISDENLSF